MRGIMINFKWVERYVEKGFACHWLNGKAPYQKEWSTSPVATVQELKRTYQPGNNLGVRVGRWSVLEPGFGLVVLDVDLRDPLGTDACYEAVEGLLGHATLNVASGRGLGGHIYMKCSLEKLPGKAATTVDEGEGWKLELLSTGKNLVVPPSVHPDTGQKYEWVSVEIGIVPEALLEKSVLASSYTEPKTVATHSLRSADVWDEGERQTRLLSYAGWLQAQGWRDDQIRAKVTAKNGYKCSPPLEQGEVEKIITFALGKTKGFNMRGKEQC
jgi:hypothetical protein